jgi:hypothetical protein
MRPFLFLAIGLLTVAALSAEPVRFASGPRQTALLELYTSEGCSSCPPADRWLSSLRKAPGLWHDFVPVEFHVDYWNRLGWPDRFATRAFTAREYAYAAAWKSDGVYTPCVVLNGFESRAGGRPAPMGPTVGRLVATYDGARLQVEFTPTSAGATEPLEVHAAVLGMGIVSNVTAGENGGAKLQHDFVALAQVQGALGHDLVLATPVVVGVPRHALAVWVTRRGELAPLQAVGGWLD